MGDELRPHYWPFACITKSENQAVDTEIMKGERISGQPYRYDKGFLIDYPL